jgi:hypothetical protein
MSRLLAAFLCLWALASTGAAQEPMTLTVRPSGVDQPDGLSPEAQEREARLRRRMEENDFLFRNICIQCGGANRAGPSAPFEPMDALGASRR